MKNAKLRAPVGGMKYRMSLGLRNLSVVNCACNSGGKTLRVRFRRAWSLPASAAAADSRACRSSA